MNQQFGGLRAGFGVQGSCGVGGFGAAETAAGVVLSATGERGLRLQLIVRPRETCQGTVGIGATGTWWLKRNDQVISFGSIRLSSRGPIGNLVRPVQLFLVSCISSSSASREKSLKNFARLQVVSLMSTGGAYFYLCSTESSDGTVGSMFCISFPSHSSHFSPIERNSCFLT